MLKSILKGVLFLSMFACGISGIEAQSIDYRFRQINIKDGLPDRWITCIGQDSLGFMWFGSREGLSRWDGQEFITYSTTAPKARKLSFNSIQDLVIEKERIWVYGDAVLNIIDLKRDSVIHDFLGPQRTNLAGIYYRGGQIWLDVKIDDQRHILRQRKGIEFDTVFTTKSLLGKGFRLAIMDSNSFWITDSELRLFRYDIMEGALDSGLNIKLRSIGENIYPQFHVDYAKRLWIFQKEPILGEILVVDSDYANYKVLTYDAALSEEIHPHHWIWTKKEKKIDTHYMNTTGQSLFPTKHKVLNDTGIEWIGTINGVVMAYPKQNYFTRYLHEEGTDIGNQMRGMLQSRDGEIYFSANTGLYLMDTLNDRVQQLNPLEATIDDVPIEPFDFGDGYLVEDPFEAEIWGIRNKYSMAKIDPKKRNVEIFLNAGGPFIGQLISLQNKVYLNSSKRPPEFMDKLPDHLRLLQFETNETKLICTTSDGNICLGGSSGFQIIDTLGGVIHKFTTETELALVDNYVYDVLEDAPGKFWIATKGGFQFIDIINSTTKPYTMDDGLSDNTVACILKDDDGFVWLSTFNGLSRFDPKDETFTNFTVDEGISHREFNHSSKLKTKDGRLFFGGLNGVTAFEPKTIPKKLYNSSPFVLTKYTKYDDKNGSELVYTGQLANITELTLDHNNRFFRFEYRLLDYINIEDIVYSYYLDGFENTWQDPSASHVAQYNNVPPGNYVFRARASIQNGLWNQSEITIQVHIKQVFYKTWWFMLSTGIILLGILYLVFKYRLAQVLKLERLRTKIASDLHDEVGSTMTRISMSSELLKTGVLNKEEEVAEIEQIALQSRVATSTMSDVIWSIDARSDRVKHLVDRMREHMEELLLPKDIKFSFNYLGLEHEKKLDVVLRQNIYLIFREAINNIVKHSNATNVQVSLFNQKKDFIMTIKDNGTDFSKSVKKGQGLKNMQMRAAMIGGQLKVDRIEGFSIRLSLKAFK